MKNDKAPIDYLLEKFSSTSEQEILGFITACLREASYLLHSNDEDDCLACAIHRMLDVTISPLDSRITPKDIQGLPRPSLNQTLEGLGLLASIPEIRTRRGVKCACGDTHLTCLQFVERVFGIYTHNEDFPEKLGGPKLSTFLTSAVDVSTIPSIKEVTSAGNTVTEPAKPAVVKLNITPIKDEREEMTMASTTAAPAAPKAKTQKEADDELYSKFKDVTLERGGSKITLPDNMSYRAAHVWLERMEEAETKKVAINELIDAHPMEGAWALAQVLDEVFGFTDMIKIPGDFFTPDILPTMFSLEVGFRKTVQVPWGRISVPQFGAGYFIETSIALKGQDFIFKLEGEVMQRDKSLVARIAELTRKKVLENSIYRGKAVYLNFPDPNDKDGRGNPRFNINNAPTFLDSDAFDETSLIFSKDLQDIIDTNILVPITKTKLCRELKIPLKRGVLLEGPYGTGKTLTANMTAKKAVENGWTFLYLQNPRDLARAIRFATKYQPAVIFMEDVDRVFGEHRDEEMNTVLNTLDGIDTKHAEVMVVLTTNHIELFHRASLRPGRLDAVISVRPPDADAVRRLLFAYASGKIDIREDLTEVCTKLADKETIPAVIREVVERAKLGALRRATSSEFILKAEDLLVATNAMMDHLDLMREEQVDTREPLEQIADSVGELASALADRIPADSSKDNKKNGSSKNHISSQA